MTIKNQAYSVTSNIVKLLKHPDRLAALQKGRVRPIMLHVLPTHRCQLNCEHCCFKNRKDRDADLPFTMFITALSQFNKLGLKSVEYSGGGEPTLWPDINRAINLAWVMGYHQGIITNGLGGDRIEEWEKFDWVRVSLNTLEYVDHLDLSYIDGTRLSFCYIWHDGSDKHIGKIVEFANDHKTVCRVAPDCIKPPGEISQSLFYVADRLSKIKNNDYVFLSDFNIDVTRHNNECRIHMIKPCLYLDGWVYACPSAELAVENDRQIQPKTRVCRFDEIEEFYLSDKAIEPKMLDCSYCKYAKQQRFLDNLLTETDFNDFV